MLRVRTAVIALAATTLAISGCGGSSKTTGTTSAAATGPSTTTSAATTTTAAESGRPLTRSELIVEANAICAHLNADLKAVNVHTVAEYGTALPRLAAQEQAGFAELGTLKPPAPMVAEWHRIVTGGETVAGDINRLAGAVASRDGSLARTLNLAGEKARDSIHAIAKRDHFTECARFS